MFNWKHEGSSGGWARGDERHDDIAATGKVRSAFLASHFRRGGRPRQGPLWPVEHVRRRNIFSSISAADFRKLRIAVHPAGTGYASGGEDGFVRVHYFDESYFKARPYGETEILN
jgi:hypothetical protein